jgi:hypothetical protein
VPESEKLQNELFEAKLANGWTLERKAKQAVLIRQWRAARCTFPSTVLQEKPTRRKPGSTGNLAQRYGRRLRSNSVADTPTT